MPVERVMGRGLEKRALGHRTCELQTQTDQEGRPTASAEIVGVSDDEYRQSLETKLRTPASATFRDPLRK